MQEITSKEADSRSDDQNNPYILWNAHIHDRAHKSLPPLSVRAVLI
jgi:hypothetical protein